MPSANKAKGNSWERAVASHLSTLYGENFLRVPNSGAYIGAKNSHRKQTMHDGQVRSFKGDIMPGQSFSKFNIECKSYKDFPFHQLFQGNVKQLDLWIDQLMAVADPGDLNFLIMKFSRKGTFILCENHKSFKLSKHLIYVKNNVEWALMDYNSFWEHNKDAVKSLAG